MELEFGLEMQYLLQLNGHILGTTLVFHWSIIPIRIADSYFRVCVATMFRHH